MEVIVRNQLERELSVAFDVCLECGYRGTMVVDCGNQWFCYQCKSPNIGTSSEYLALRQDRKFTETLSKLTQELKEIKELIKNGN